MSLLLLFAGATTGAVVAPVVQPDRSDGKPRRVRNRRWFNADDELTEAEVQFMQRKLQELKRAKTEREKNAKAKELEVALAQAAQDELAAEAIRSAMGGKSPARVMRDPAALGRIIGELERIVRDQQDEDDLEILLLSL